MGLISYQPSFSTKFANHFDRGQYLDALNDLEQKGQEELSDGVNIAGNIIGGGVSGVVSGVSDALLNNPILIVFLALGIIVLVKL